VGKVFPASASKSLKRHESHLTKYNNN